jgi:hypothetical protein
VAGFDGELYLRLLGERALLSGGNQRPFGDPLVEQARALATVGVVPASVAQRVVDDYARARALRGWGRPTRHLPTAAAAPPPHRIARCGQVIKGPTGDLELRYAILGPAETRLAITFRSSAQVPPHERNRPAVMPIGVTAVPSITVTDDRGSSVTSSAFTGSGTVVEWRGFLTLRPALAPHTSWLELYGERVELGEDVSDRAVRVESFAETDAAERYLAQCLAAARDRPHPRPLAEALAALTAAGLVDPADPAVAATLAIHEALTWSGGRYPTPSAGPPAAPPAALPAALPAGPWRQLLARRGSIGGPAGTLFVGAVTPVFDRIIATLLDLVSADGGFQCDFELAGPVDLGLADGSPLDRVFVTFSALDDQGNRYLGHPGTWQGGDGTASGSLGFWPALDPRATRLELILTTDRARATVTVPLAWEAAQ